MDPSLILLNKSNYSSTSPLKVAKLRIRDDCFEYETGERFTVKECTDFRLFKRFLDGEDIRPVLEQRANLGFNMLRVLGTCHNMFRLYPKEYGLYFPKLDEFFNLCQKYIFLEFTVFADAPYALPSLTDQQMLFGLVGEISRNYYNFLELVNENDDGTFCPAVPTITTWKFSRQYKSCKSSG